MRFVDLFSGLGGFNLAASQLGHECVFSSEIDSRLQRIYKLNFGIEPKGDISDISSSDIPPHELLCAGFPCQPFSKAGGQLGLNDKLRGSVFFHVIRILKYHQPQFVILENVAHFIRHDNGNTYRKLKTSLEKIGYDVQIHQLSPHQFGIPQIRERMYLVGSLNGLENFIWPKPFTDKRDLNICDVLDEDPPDSKKINKQVKRCLEVWQEFLQLYPQDKKLPSFPIWAMEFKANYPYTNYDSLYEAPLDFLRKCKGAFGCKLDYWFREDILRNLPSYARGKGTVLPKWKKKFILQNRELYEQNKDWIDRWLPKIMEFPPSLQKLEWNCQGEERDIWRHVIQFRSSGVRVKRPSTSPSLVAMTTTQVPIIGWERRYITPRECARLQSMESLEHLPSGEAAIKALGNAINVTVARIILEELLSERNRVAVA